VCEEYPVSVHHHSDRVTSLQPPVGQGGPSEHAQDGRRKGELISLSLTPFGGKGEGGGKEGWEGEGGD
jgi:hypothetical protein